MKRNRAQNLTNQDLVERFIEIGAQQGEALLRNEIARFNKLYSRKTAIVDEMKARPGDQRILLAQLYDHENAQVRLNAARATLAVAPQAARQVLEAIANSRRFPQAFHAGMSLDILDGRLVLPGLNAPNDAP